jgi:hypothetical protein
MGWCAHYSIGVTFAAVLLAAFGLPWARSPSLFPALLIGIVTVLAPLLVLQLALGAGIKSRDRILEDPYPYLQLREEPGHTHCLWARFVSRSSWDRRNHPDWKVTEALAWGRYKPAGKRGPSPLATRTRVRAA